MSTVVVAMYALFGSAITSGGSIRGRLEGLMSGTSVVEMGPGALKKEGDGKGPLAELFSGSITEKLAVQLERADLSISPSEFIVLRFGLALVGLVAPIVFLHGVLSYLAAAAALVVGYNLPKWYLNRRRTKRVNKLNEQLPEALQIISNSLKAGFGMLQALNGAAEQLEHPIATELSRTIHEMNIGSSAEVALLALGERAGSYDLDIVITAILVQRTVGGNLGEILDTVGETMRERIRIRGEITTLTAQQKLTGLVIGCLPVGVGVLFQFMSPEYIHPLFSTFVGNAMLAAAGVLEVVGLLIIQRILNIEV
jgi:tight adherence protein B